MKPTVIFGASQFAETVHYYLTRDAGRQVAAFTVDAAYVREPTLCGVPIVPFEEISRQFPADRFSMFVALGPHRVNSVRAEKFDAAVSMGYELLSYISSKANVWPDLEYGPNLFITEGSTVMPFTRLGKNVCLWQARLGHHVRVDDHCMITGGSLPGGVEVGERTFIGINASVKEQVRIGKRNVIGAGAVINLSTRDDAVHAVHHTRASRVPSSRLRVI